MTAFNHRSSSASDDGFSVASLERVPLLHRVSPAHLEAARSVITRRIVQPGEVLLNEDEAGGTIFLIMEGAFKITVRKGQGTVVLGLCGRGDLLGELAAIDGHARSATVSAQTPCVIGTVSADDFWKTLWPLAPVPLNMAHLLAGRVRRLTAKVQAMATLDVRGRLAFQLVTLACDHALEEGGGVQHIPFGLTQAELAQMVGTSRVQVNQLMTTWTKNGILTARRTQIVIHHLEALCQMFPASLEAASASPPWN